jgi:uroporphyrinogen-III synthase
MGGYLLNTRPADRAAHLTQSLRAAGYQVSELPLLAFESCPLGAADQQALQQIATQSVVVVISPMAAQLGLAHLLRLEVSVQAVATRWIAVGQATAQVLRQAGLAPMVPALETSEGVVALPAFAELTAMQSVMIWRGEAGRELIQLQLQQQQVSLSSLAFYRRVQPQGLADDWAHLTHTMGWPDVVLISSAEAWRHWQQLTGAQALQPWLLVLGQRLLQQLQRLTPRVVAVSDLQPQTLAQALQDLMRPLRQEATPR